MLSRVVPDFPHKLVEFRGSLVQPLTTAASPIASQYANKDLEFGLPVLPLLAFGTMFAVSEKLSRSLVWASLQVSTVTYDIFDLSSKMHELRRVGDELISAASTTADQVPSCARL